jgi:autotransporter-associated beta strand protein
MSASRRGLVLHVCCLAVILVSGLYAPNAQAATWWWNTITTGTWTNAALWSNAATGGSTGAGPANSTTTDVVVFNQTSTNGAVTALLGQDQSIGGITGTNTGATTIQSSTTTLRTLTLGTSGIAVNAGAGAFTIGATGSAVNVAISGTQSWTNNSSNIFTVNGGISSSVSGTQTLTIGGSGNTTLAGSITNGSGTMAISKSGAGTLTLSALNGYTGNTTVTGGTLALSGGLTGTMGVVTAGPSTTINIQSGSYATTGFVVNSGSVSQSGGFVRLTGGNQLVIGNAASTTGVYTLTGGTISSGTASTSRGIMLGVGGVSGTFNMSGGLIDLTTNGTATLQIGRYDGGTGQSGAFNQTGGVATIGNLSIGGSGTVGSGGSQLLTLTGGTFTAASFPRLSRGDSNVATITIGGSADVTLPAFPSVSGSSATATLYFNGGVLRPAAASASYMGGLTNAFVQAGGATFNVASGRDITISQALVADGTSAGGGLTKSGSGTLTLSASNSYTGGTQINQGTLALGTSGAIGSTGTISFGGGTLGLFDTTDFSNRFSTAASQAYRIDTNGQNVTLGTALTSSGGSLSKSGSGTLTVSGAIGYTGATDVSSGTLELSGGSSGIMGLLTANSGGVVAIRSNTYSIAGITLSSPGVGIVNQTGGIVNLSSSGGFQLILGNGPGGSSTYTLASGTLNTGLNSANWGIVLGRNTNSSGTFAMSGGVLNMTTGGTSTLQIGFADGATFTGQTGVFSQAGGLATVGNLSIGGNGTAGSGGTQSLTLTGGTFTAVSFPRLSAGNSNVATIRIGGSADVTLPAFPSVTGSSASATLYFNGGVLRPAAASASYMGGLTNAFIQTGGAGFNVASGRDITISQALLADDTSAGGGLTKQGDGTLTLSGSNSYTGATMISAGVLALGVNGSFAASNVIKVGDASSSNAILDLTAKTAAFAIEASQTLSGGGTVLVAPGQHFQVQGTFAPGNSPGLFTFDGGTTVLAGTTVMEIFGTSRATAPSHGSGFYDAVNVSDNGTLQFGGNLTFEFSSLFDDNTTFALFTPASGSSLAGNFTGVNVTGGFYSGLTWGQSGSIWKSSNTGGGQSLEFSSTTGQLVVVPEPGALALAGLGIALATWAARRR